MAENAMLPVRKKPPLRRTISFQYDDIDDKGDFETTNKNILNLSSSSPSTGVQLSPKVYDEEMVSIKKRKLLRRLSSIPYAGKYSSMASFDCIERPLSVLFYKYGRHISRHPYPAIIFPLLLTAALSFGLLHKNEILDAIYLFTPTNALSKYERQVIHQLWPLHQDNYIPGRAITESRETQIIVVAKNGANILEERYKEAIVRLDQFIQKRISVENQYGNWTYDNLCLRWKTERCPGNDHVSFITDLYIADLNITFPTLRLGYKLAYLGSTMGGVSLKQGPNGTNFVASSRAWLMIYHLKFYPENASYVAGLWENELQRLLLDEYPPDPYISFSFFHSQTLTEELKKNADSLRPRFVIAFLILILFSILCSISLIRHSLFIDWVLSKPVLSLMGVINAGMGVISAIGLLNFLGMPYNPIVSVMPFLVVAIGVDNMFLMVAALRRTNRALSIPKRIGECLSDAAISITITALTDALSFGIGVITTMPIIQIFCVYTSLAIVITFIYQLTFFCGLLVLGARLESAGLHCILMSKTVTPQEAKSRSVVTRAILLGSRASSDATDLDANVPDSATTAFFRDWYAPVLMQPLVRTLVVFWFIVYLTFAVYGCTQLREGLEPANFLVHDSYAVEHYRYLEDYFLNYGPALQVVVNKAPDLRDPEERLKLKSMISHFANTRHTIGDGGVQYFLNEVEFYYVHQLQMSMDDRAIYGLIRHFLSTSSHEKWAQDMTWGEELVDGERRIKSFRFLVGLKHFGNTNDQRATTELMRMVAGTYPRYNITTFMPAWLFTDQYSLVLPNTLQNIGIAMACMSLIALLLIPQPLCSLWVAVAIASIDIGVVGYMTLWGVNLDAISMITIIMSIGFSVDFSAHICYGYVISDEHRPTERVRMALGALGWPILQGALSTVLGVSVLSTVQAYMIVTFFKTVFLVICIGVLHGLVFLPVMLSLFVRGCCVLGSPPSVSLAARKTSMMTGDGIGPVGKKPSLARMPSLSLPTVDGEELSPEDDVQPFGRYGIYLPRISTMSEQSNSNFPRLTRFFSLPADYSNVGNRIYTIPE